MRTAPPPELRHTIPAVLKTLDLLRAVADRPEGASIRSLASQLAVPRTTCYRIVRSLVAHDWLRPGDGDHFVLSLSLLSLLEPLRPLQELARHVQASLDALAAESGLTAKLSVRQGDHAITVARRESPRATHVDVKLGASFHLAFGSSGATLLAPLPDPEIATILDRAPPDCWAHQSRQDVLRRIRQIRARGYASDPGGYRPDCHAVSAPLHDSSGTARGAVTLIGFPHELHPRDAPRLARSIVARLRPVARTIEPLPGHAHR